MLVEPWLSIAPSCAPEGACGIKSRIQQAQLQAMLAVNRELILLYWQIGRGILERQQQQGWGAKVIDRLSHDLHIAFPQMKGFSPHNLKYMRAFALSYRDEAFVQEVLAQITWYHQVHDLASRRFQRPVACS